jgi:hypothetical protein
MKLGSDMHLTDLSDGVCTAALVKGVYVNVSVTMSSLHGTHETSV